MRGGRQKESDSFKAQGYRTPNEPRMYFRRSFFLESLSSPTILEANERASRLLLTHSESRVAVAARTRFHFNHVSTKAKGDKGGLHPPLAIWLLLKLFGSKHPSRWTSPMNVSFFFLSLSLSPEHFTPSFTSS